MSDQAMTNVDAGHDNPERNKGEERISGNSSPSQSSENSLSLSNSPMLLPENGASSISEHMSSVENDRSFSEIDISNHFPQILLNQTDDLQNISQEKIPSLNSTNKSDDSEVTLTSASKNVKSILDEILHNDQFKSEKSDSFSCHSNEASLNIFGGVNLDDSSINNYVLRLKSNEFDMTDNNSLNEQFYAGNFVETPKSLNLVDDLKIRSLEDILSVKDTTINALNMELDSFRELTSNQSTFSLNTTTTEYKQCHEEFSNKLVEYETAMEQRDNIIDKLKESLEQSVDKRFKLEQESELFAKEIVALQTELAQATNFIKTCQCKSKLTQSIDEVPYDSLENSEKCNNLETICSNFQITLAPTQTQLFTDLKTQLNDFINDNIQKNRASQNNEIKTLKDQLNQEKTQYDSEINRLRELLGSIKCGSTEIMELRQELEANHMHEMEELRKYYEKKCADVEKNYSEEIFSQQSRKMSGSSTGSEPELVSDLIYSQPGPGGDASSLNKFNFKLIELQSSDLIAFKKQVDELTIIFNKYDLISGDLNVIKNDLSRFDFKPLLKIDLLQLKNELRDDFVVKLENLKAENAANLNLLTEEHENRVNDLEEQLEKMQIDLDETKEQIVNTLQETSSSDGNDPMEIIHSYERQIAISKIEIFDALELQIQKLASSPDVTDEEWPPEFLQIRKRFEEKYQTQIDDLKMQQEEQISKLKQDHLRALNGAFKRRNSRDFESLGDLEAIKEKIASPKKNTAALYNLLTELQTYFTQCETEVNNTLVDELIKQSNDNDPNNSKVIHFAPDISQIYKLVENSTLDESFDVKSELGLCLQRLKSDANAVLMSSLHLKEANDSPDERAKSLEDRINSLTRRLISDSQIKSDLSEQLEEARNFVHSLERERASLDTQIEEIVAKNNVLQRDLNNALGKINDLVECGRKEIVSEGYGEDNRMGLHGGLAVSVANLNELQERARILVTESTNLDNPMLQLIEELCREGDRISEEAKKDHDDLIQQIEVADKKLRENLNFLEEQAAEREMERDDAQKEIIFVKDQLRDREKDRINCERINIENANSSTMNLCCRTVHQEIVSTVEQLEQQMRSMSQLMDESDKKLNEISQERTEAVDQIYVLRDIVNDLEKQVVQHEESGLENKEIIAKLEQVIVQHREVNDELQKQLEGEVGSSDLHERLLQLEEDNQRLRLAEELVGNEGALKHIQIQLHQIELSIDKRIHDLESLHAISTTTCSSPSEDMSIRDHVRPKTPNSALDECDVPLQQLARLKEKLVKHSRAEDAAVKRIRDLEMQLITTKHEQDEIQNERDLYQDQIHEQLALISSLQMRLDDQRLRAEHIQKQTNTSLEARIYDLETEVQSLHDQLHKKDKSIKQLKKDVEQTKQSLTDREKELTNALDDNLVVNLQQEIDSLRNANVGLKSKIESDAQNVQILPGLVDNIITDKNQEIDKLRAKLSDTQKHLDLYSTLNLDHDQLKQLSQVQNFSGILSLIDFADLEMRKSRGESLDHSNLSHNSHKIKYMRKSNEPSLLFSGEQSKSLTFEPEISSIERVGPPNINFTVDAPLVKPNSTEIHRSSERRVRFEDTIDDSRFKTELNGKDLIIKDLKIQLETYTDLELKINALQNDLDRTEAKLLETNASYESGRKEMFDLEKQLRLELAENKMHLKAKSDEINLINEDTKRKDQMYVNLAKEKRDLEKDLNALKSLECHVTQIELLEAKLLELQSTLKEAAVFIEEKDVENEKLDKELKNKVLQLNEQFLEIKQLRDATQALENKLKHLENLMQDRDCELEILNEDIVRYQNDIHRLESDAKRGKNLDDSETQLKLMKNRKEVAEKDLEIIKLKTIKDDLNKEIIHLQDYLNEKDKIIEQMRLDSKSLQTNLETIQNKMQETGNVVDLSQKLQLELDANANLRAELHELKNLERNSDMIESIEEITGQVRNELDVSAHLDANIMNALNSGDFSTINDSNILRQLINKERTQNAELNGLKDELETQLRNLEEKYDLAINKIHEFQTLLENERQSSELIQIEDANLIEQMRINLEAALDNENELKTILDFEKKRFINLENQFKLKSNSSSKSDYTEYKSLPTLESQEIVRLRAELDATKEENLRIKKDLKALKKIKCEVDAGLKYSKDLLNLKGKEIDKLEKNINKMREQDLNSKEKLAEMKVDLDQRKREVENSRILLGELEEEKNVVQAELGKLKQQLVDLQEEQALLKTASNEKDADLSSPLPEKFLRKMKDLGELVTDHINENKAISETMCKLTEERTQLQDRVKELEEQNVLHMPFDDPTARANHLFGKYLRADSYRKALIWQKCFLIRLLSTYQEIRPLEDRHYLNKFEPMKKVAVKSKGAKRFRIVALGIVATIRMHFLVQRWHCGKRHGAYISLKHKFTPTVSTTLAKTVLPTTHSTQTYFHVGQPVSSKNFSSNPRRVSLARPTELSASTTAQRGGGSSNTTYEVPRVSTPPEQQGLPPWSGFTPPSKDKTRSCSSRDINIPSTSDNLAPLKTPEILSRYIERFDLIQQRLGMTLESHSQNT